MPETAIRIGEIAFTVYPVEDMQRARRFYEGILHLPPVTVAENGIWVEYDVKGSAFCLGKFEGLIPSATAASIAFEVDNLDETLQTLHAENVPFRMEGIESPVCRMAIIMDPEGNAVIIHQRKSR